MADSISDVISKVAGETKTINETREEQVQMVVFDLDKEEYAVPIDELKEIIKIPEITPLPSAPEFIKGILNLRGKIVVVIDLEKRFNLNRENKIPSTHIIISEVEGNSFGIIVDKVSEVLRVPISAVKPSPSLVSTKIHADYLKGVVVLDNRLIILLDLVKLLQEQELLKIGEEIKRDT